MGSLAWNGTTFDSLARAGHVHLSTRSWTKSRPGGSTGPFCNLSDRWQYFRWMNRRVSLVTTDLTNEWGFISFEPIHSSSGLSKKFRHSAPSTIGWKWKFKKWKWKFKKIKKIKIKQNKKIKLKKLKKWKLKKLKKWKIFKIDRSHQVLIISKK